MRKVYLTITTKTMVPIVSTIKAIVTLDENADISKVAKQIVNGPTSDDYEVVDSHYEKYNVENSDSEDFSEEIEEFLNSTESVSEVVNFEVTDSK